MPSDKVKLFGKLLILLVPLAFKTLYQRIQALRHRWSYKQASTVKNVVVLGASFTGVQLTTKLSESLPTGYRVVMIEKNSHFNYSFNFPRYSVLLGHEKNAFIPYDGIARGAPKGVFHRVHDTAVQITKNQVHLASGGMIDYAYLAIATGSWQPVPAKVTSADRTEACAELRGVQDKIKLAKKIAIVGGGAVGVELAADIMSFYPEKHVTLIHSRAQLLPHFGIRLHEHVLTVFKELGVQVILGERPQIFAGVVGDDDKNDGEQKSLRFADGHTEGYDFIIPCTGQRPNTSFLTDLAPASISKTTSRILVHPNLQISDPDNALPHIFALGDVAESGGPKMARAGQFQSDIVQANIIAMVKGQHPSITYKPRVDIEGAIKLTLGKSQSVIYLQEDDGSDLLVSTGGGKEDLDVSRAWSSLGVKLKDHSVESENSLLEQIPT